MFPRMKSSFALFCQAALVVIGIGVFAFLLWEPHVEGRNAHATVFQIYCQDPFLAYVYIGSTPFFVALYRAWRLFGHARQAGGFSLGTLTALHAIRRCALAIVGFVAGGVVIILLFGDPEDRPAGIFMSLLVALPACAVALATTRFARRLQTALPHAAG